MLPKLVCNAHNKNGPNPVSSASQNFLQLKRSQESRNVGFPTFAYDPLPGTISHSRRLRSLCARFHVQFVGLAGTTPLWRSDLRNRSAHRRERNGSPHSCAPAIGFYLQLATQFAHALAHASQTDAGLSAGLAELLQALRRYAAPVVAYL